MAVKLSDKIRADLSNQLIKIADLMETCDHGDPFYKELNKDYKKIAKTLYPEMYKHEAKSRRRKPNQKMINELTLCICGHKTFKYQANATGITISCPNCTRSVGPTTTNREAVTAWNNTFTELFT